MKRHLLYRIFLLVAIILIITNCSKKVDEDITSDPDPVEETFNYTSSNKYNLNVIYFIPKGIKNRTDSHRRLSEILLQGQEFFKKYMKANGFGEKTFSMLVDKEKQRVKIDYVEGNFDFTYYPYEGGGLKMKEEIESYYANNPDKNNSDHYLVISPVEDPKKSDAPYYGLGKWCFATDYNEMDIKYLNSGSAHSRNATVYIGGLLHELGHGLNLPHNKEKVSDASSSDKGTALMGAGNYTYGSTPTFITKASCAILNNNQVFNTSNSTFYSGASGSIDNLKASFENGEIKVSGKINTDVSVDNLSIYHDPADDNADYDAVTWSTKIEANNTFSISMPINELHKKGNTEYVLRILLNHTSGNITRLSYFYKFVNDVPIIDFGEKDYLDKTNWKIESFSSEESSGQETTGLATAIIDNDKETYWHSCWNGGCSSAEYPHYLTVNTGASTVANGFAFVQRKSLSRSIKSLEILTSDDNVNWTSMGTFDLKNINTIQNIDLASQKTFKYFKLQAKSAHDESRFAALAEVYIY